jgi:hypothetical protein
MSVDYGHTIEFGYFLIPDASDPLGVIEAARLVDRLGYDLIGVQDHPFQARHFDTLALLVDRTGQIWSISSAQDTDACVRGPGPSSSPIFRWAPPRATPSVASAP